MDRRSGGGGFPALENGLGIGQHIVDVASIAGSEAVHQWSLVGVSVREAEGAVPFASRH